MGIVPEQFSWPHPNAHGAKLIQSTHESDRKWQATSFSYSKSIWACPKCNFEYFIERKFSKTAKDWTKNGKELQFFRKLGKSLAVLGIPEISCQGLGILELSCQGIKYTGVSLRVIPYRVSKNIFFQVLPYYMTWYPKDEAFPVEPSVKYQFTIAYLKSETLPIRGKKLPKFAKKNKIVISFFFTFCASCEPGFKY